MRNIRQAWKFWLLPLLWMIVIFSASADGQSAHHSSRIFEPLMHWLFPQMSPLRIGEIQYLFRKCMHLTEFAVLAGLLWWALRHTKGTAAGPWQWSDAGQVLILVVLYAASDEIHQAFIPSRTGRFSDVLVDTAGGAIGLGWLWLWGKMCKMRIARRGGMA
ncbi:MAG: VanZ family protein [Verrucomicrobiota bacterium]